MSNTFARRKSLATCLTLAILCCAGGCQNNRAAVVPPPGGLFPPADGYYTPPPGAGAAAPFRPGSTGAASGAAVSLAPQNTTSAAPRTSSTRDTYDVAARVPADGQPIRVIDSTSRAPNTSYVNASRGMPVNDGTNASPFRVGPPVASVSSNPLSGLRGTGDTRSASSQGFSGGDGQWRSRSSYEATERR